MTAYETIMVIIGILSLLIAFAGFIIAFIRRQPYFWGLSVFEFFLYVK